MDPVVVSSPEGNQRIPLEAIDALVVLGAAHKLPRRPSRNASDVVYASPPCGWVARFDFIVGGATGGNVHLRTALYRAVIDEGHSLALSKGDCRREAPEQQEGGRSLGAR